MTTLKADMADHLDLQSLENMEQATCEKVKTFATELSARRAKKLLKIMQAPSKSHRQTRSTFQTSNNNSSSQDTATHNIISKNINVKKRQKRNRRFRHGSKRIMPVNYKANVYKLSNISLTSGQLDLLGKGLGFSVSPLGVDKFQIEADTNEFVRRLRLREYFHGRDDNGATSRALSEHPPKIQKHTNKNWIPESGRNVFLDSYINVLKEEIGKPNITKVFSNISNQERKALSELKARAGGDILIMPADKGCGTCVVSREDYGMEGNRQLSHLLTHKVLNHDITNKVKKSEKSC